MVSPLPDAMLQKQAIPLLHSISLEDDTLNFNSHKKQHKRKHPVSLSGNSKCPYPTAQKQNTVVSYKNDLQHHEGIYTANTSV